MGGTTLPYPDVSDAQVYDIYKQSEREPIFVYGFFIGSVSIDSKQHPNRSMYPPDHEFKHIVFLLSDICMGVRLRNTRLDSMSIVRYPAPESPYRYCFK
jgi:hypothetical protein